MSETLEIGSVKPRIRYEGDGTTTEFSFAFTIFDETDVDVYADDALLTEGYSVSRETQGGRVIFDKAPAAGTIITLYRSLELKRTTNFQEVGPFRTSKVNLEFDYQLACMEQLQDTISRTVTFPPYAPTQLNVALPMPVPGKAIIWNAEGNSLQNSTIEIEKLTACYDDVLKKAQEVCNNAAAAASACQNPPCERKMQRHSLRSRRRLCRLRLSKSRKRRPNRCQLCRSPAKTRRNDLYGAERPGQHFRSLQRRRRTGHF